MHRSKKDFTMEYRLMKNSKRIKRPSVCSAWLSGTNYIQGFISLIETTEAMGGNCVVRGTHTRYDELVQRCIELTGK